MFLTILIFAFAMYAMLRIRDGMDVSYRCPRCGAGSPNHHRKDCEFVD